MSELGRKDVTKRKRQGITPPMAPKKRVRSMTCPRCNGLGETYAYHTGFIVICSRCHGTGWIEEDGDESN